MSPPEPCRCVYPDKCFCDDPAVIETLEEEIEACERIAEEDGEEPARAQLLRSALAKRARVDSSPAHMDSSPAHGRPRDGERVYVSHGASMADGKGGDWFVIEGQDQHDRERQVDSLRRAGRTVLDLGIPDQRHVPRFMVERSMFVLGRRHG